MSATAAAMAVFAPDPGYYRDRSNRVFDDGTRIVRGVSADVLSYWRRLSGEPFYRAFVDEALVVATEEITYPDAMPGDWAGYLAHERIPVISYPYEWSFGMLRDAALLQLEIIERSIPAGWTLKDATPYNVQWRGTRPVFIDIPSFEPYRSGDAWVGYRQFCMMYLYPLMLKAYKGIDYIPFLRSNLEGIEPDQANQILSGASRLRKGVLGNVYLHAKMHRKYASSDLDEAKSLTETSGEKVQEKKAIRHSEAMVLGTIQGLRRVVEKLSIVDSRTVWGNYDTDHSYGDVSYQAKKDFVEKHIKAKPRRVTWDIGCNTGTFSRLARGHSDYILSIDGDSKAIERLYQHEKAQGTSDLLPLIMNIGNLSPDQGWRGKERKALEKRGKPDIVLCLALIHHIVISANIPLSEFMEWLRGLESDIVIELVGLDDDMTKMLLRGRVNQYEELGQANFERVADLHFRTEDSLSLKGGHRKIYYLTPR